MILVQTETLYIDLGSAGRPDRREVRLDRIVCDALSRKRAVSFKKKESMNYLFDFAFCRLPLFDAASVGYTEMNEFLYQIWRIVKKNELNR